MLNRCATCKHWRPMGMSDELFRECAVIRAIPYRVKVEDAKLPAFTEFDGDGEFITPPDFGCTLWESKS
jgi:hypothetical protein